MPKRHLRGAVVVAHPWPQPDVQAGLLPRRGLRPGHRLELVWKHVDELSDLRQWVFGVPAGGDTRETCEVIQETCDVTHVPSAEKL